MANIIEVDYNAIPGQAMSMRNFGKEINRELVSVYQEITNMQNVWCGRRYNLLAQGFNKIIPELNEMLNLVVTEIPSTLENVANNYALADTGSTITSVNTDGPQKITEIAIPSDVTKMRFITYDVANTQSKVTKGFQSILTDMENIQSQFSRISWKSTAADAFAERFGKIKNDITESFDDLSSQFTTLMEEAKTDFESSENANTLQ